MHNKQRGNTPWIDNINVKFRPKLGPPITPGNNTINGNTPDKS